MKHFYDTICSIYSIANELRRWSLVETKQIKYENIKCAIYHSTRDLYPTLQAVETDSNGMTMVLDCKYPWVHIWDIVIIKDTKYKVMYEPIEHHRYNWQLDNFELYIKRTTDD